MRPPWQHAASIYLLPSRGASHVSKGSGLCHFSTLRLFLKSQRRPACLNGFILRHLAKLVAHPFISIFVLQRATRFRHFLLRNVPDHLLFLRLVVWGSLRIGLNTEIKSSFDPAKGIIREWQLGQSVCGITMAAARQTIRRIFIANTLPRALSSACLIYLLRNDTARGRPASSIVFSSVS